MSAITPTKEEIDALLERTKLLVKKWGPLLNAPPSTGSAMLIEPQQKELKD